MSWHDMGGADDHSQKAAFETAVKKSLQHFLFSAPKYVSETHSVQFLYPNRGAENDVVNVSVRVQWSNNPDSEEQVESCKIRGAFDLIMKDIGAYCEKAGLNDSKKTRAGADIQELGSDFFAFNVQLPLWHASPRNKNLKRDLLDHKSVIMISNITVDQSVEVLKPCFRSSGSRSPVDCL